MRGHPVIPEALLAVMPYAGGKVQTYAPLLTVAMSEFAINSPIRQAAFLAQIAKESGSLVFVQEIADGSAYEGRTDLGNVQPGDGKRFKGRGLLQITGRINYTICGNALGLDLIANPELLEQPANACRSAAWFWSWKGLNEQADRGNFGTITKTINGGYNGLDDRIKFYIQARKVFGL